MPYWNLWAVPIFSAAVGALLIFLSSQPAVRGQTDNVVPPTHKVTLRKENIPLTQALKELETQTGIAVGSALKNDPPLAVCERNQSNDEAVLIGDEVFDVRIFRLPSQVEFERDSVGNSGGKLKLPRRFTNCVAHLGKRERDDFASQHLIERRQAIELEQPHHRPERESVDEQGEQHKARRQHGDQTLRRRVDVGIFGHGER